MAELDKLEIEITGTSDDAVKHIDGLVSSLNNLRTAAKGGAGLESVTARLRELSTSARGVSDTGKTLTQLSTALKGLSGVKVPSGLNSLRSQLTKLKGSLSGNEGAVFAGNLDSVVAGLKNLSGIESVKISSSIGNQIKAIGEALSNIQPSDGDKLKNLADSLRPLSELGKASLTTFINQLKKLPEVVIELEKVNIGKFSEQMKDLSSAIAPLANEMNKVSAGFSAFPQKIRQAISANAALEASNAKAAKSYGVLGTGISHVTARFGIYLAVARRVVNTMAGWVKESSAYVENLNLFTVSMGEYASAAKEYAETVQALTGVDSSEWMRNQGTFMQVASGFGVASEQAAIMSKNLTQLGYDLSSFFNIDIESAMNKLQSGLAGEIEPLRRLGYAIEQASLEQVALNHGITESVANMTAGEKAMLRYVAIMEQSTNAMGDMARTVQTPANAMRILQQQVTQLARAFGNILIPVLQYLIPVVQAVVEVLTEAAQAIALLFGFELPTIDYSGLDDTASSATDVEEALDAAGGAAGSLKKQLLGIDELNIFEPNSGGGGGSGSGALGEGWDIELPEYDFLDGLLEDANALKDTIKELINDYWLPLANIIAALTLSRLIDSINAAKGPLSKLKKWLAAAMVVAMEVYFNYKTMKNYLETGDLKEIIFNAISGALASWLLYKMFGPAGMLFGVGVAVAVNAVTIGLEIAKGNVEVDDPKVWIASLVTVLTGGVGAALGLKMLTGIGYGAGFGIGVSIAAAITLAAINFGGIASGSFDAGSIQSMLLSAGTIIAAGIGGKLLASALIGSAAGPVGLAIGLGVGLVLTIGAIVAGDKEDIQNVVMDEFLNYNQDGVTITEFAGAFSGLADTIKAEFQGISAASANLDVAKENISEITTAIGQMALEMSAAGGSIEEDAEKMKDLFADLSENIVAYFDEMKNVLVAGLAGNVGTALESLGGDVTEATSTVIKITGQAKEVTLDLADSLNELNAAFDAGEISEAEYLKTYFETLQSVEYMTGNASESLTKFADGLHSISDTSFADITAGGVLDVDLLHEQLGNIVSTFESTGDEILAGYDELQSEVDKIFDWHSKGIINLTEDDLNVLSQLSEAIKLDGERSLGLLRDYVGVYAMSYEKDILGGLSSEMDRLSAEWESKGSSYKLFNPKDEYVMNGINTYRKKIVEPLISALEEDLSKMGVELEPFFDEAWEDIMTILGSGKWDGSTPEFIGEFMAAIESEIEAKSADLNKAAAEAGYQASLGLAAGFDRGINDNITSIISITNKLPAAVRTALEIHSPSRVMKEIGEQAAAGLEAGMATLDTSAVMLDNLISNMIKLIDAFAYSVTDMFSDTATGISQLFDKTESENRAFTQSLADMFRNMADSSVNQIQRVIDRLSLIPDEINTTINVSSKNGLGSHNISAYASGGFPDYGEMFIAREAGPEMVGRIGNRTAVANNDQIVDGIASANEGVINAIYAMARQIVSAVESSNVEVYVDGDGTKTQNRRNRMYGKTLQRI